MLKAMSVSAGLALAAMFASPPALSQTFPQRPITMVVPFAAGGGTDILARKVAEKMATSLGQPIVVENKPGAATMIGAEYVKNAEADGYTLLAASTSTFALVPNSYKNPRYSFDDFAAISRLIDYSHAFVARADAPFDDFAGMVDYARKNPGKLTFGTTGRGGVVHLQQLEMNRKLNIQTVDVSYSGGAPALKDVLGKRLDVYLDGILPVAQYLKSKEVKIIALSGKEPSPVMKDVKTLAASGFPQLTHDLWITLAAPAKTPADVIARLNEAAKDAILDPTMQQWMVESGYVPVYTSPEEESAKIKADAEAWGGLIKEFGISIQ